MQNIFIISVTLLTAIFSLYLLHLSKAKTKLHNRMKDEIRSLAKQNMEQYIDNILDDLVTQTIVSVQEEFVSELTNGYVSANFKRMKTRFTDIMPYIIERDLKWKIIRDTKKYVQEDVPAYIDSNQKHISELMKLAKEKSDASKETIDTLSANPVKKQSSLISSVEEVTSKKTDTSEKILEKQTKV